MAAPSEARPQRRRPFLPAPAKMQWLGDLRMAYKPDFVQGVKPVDDHSSARIVTNTL